MTQYLTLPVGVNQDLAYLRPSYRSQMVKSCQAAKRKLV